MKSSDTPLPIGNCLSGPKPLNHDGSVHKCMLKGVKKFRKITGDPIIDNCNYNRELTSFENIHWSCNTSLLLRQVI
jgi:hypothetical protein